MHRIEPSTGIALATRMRRWWKRAGAAQADATLFVVYYTVLAPFAFLVRRSRAWKAGGWISRDAESGNRMEILRRQH
jgi:hypothetical protein